MATRFCGLRAVAYLASLAAAMAPAGASAPPVAEAAVLVEEVPPCRKSPDLAALTVPVLERPGETEQVLVAFGGKGWVWKEKKHHKKKLKQKVTMLADTWHYSFANRSWKKITTSEEPVARWKTASTTVFNSSALAMFGGDYKTKTKYVLNDLWVFSAQPATNDFIWRQVKTQNPPLKRRGHVAVANDTHFVIFGGKTYMKGSNDRCMTDLWALPRWALHSQAEAESGELPRWTQGASFPAGCRWGATGDVLLDSSGKKYLAMFGGRWLNPNYEQHTTTGGAYTYYDELWLYDFVEDRWFEAPTVGARPEPRDHHGAANLNNDIFIYGGRQSENRLSGSVLQDTWSYSILTHRWTKHESKNGVEPSARYMPGVASAHYKGRTVLAVFAGETLPGSTKKTTLNDLWIFDPQEGIWSEEFRSDCRKPEPAEEHPPEEQQPKGSPPPWLLRWLQHWLNPGATNDLEEAAGWAWLSTGEEVVLQIVLYAAGVAIGVWVWRTIRARTAAEARELPGSIPEEDYHGPFVAL